MPGWLFLLGLAFPALVPIALLLGLVPGRGGGAAGAAFLPPGHHPAPLALMQPVDPFLFRPVTPETDDAFMPAAAGIAVEAPGALCLVCGDPKATGDHTHLGV